MYSFLIPCNTSCCVMSYFPKSTFAILLYIMPFTIIPHLLQTECGIMLSFPCFIQRFPFLNNINIWLEYKGTLNNIVFISFVNVKNYLLDIFIVCKTNYDLITYRKTCNLLSGHMFIPTFYPVLQSQVNQYLFPTPSLSNQLMQYILSSLSHLLLQESLFHGRND